MNSKKYLKLSNIILLVAILFLIGAFFFSGELFLTGNVVSIDEGLIAYYSFDDINNLAKDDSGNGLDGTVNGAAYVGFGRIGGAVNFDGVDDYVDLSNLDLPAGTGEMSISLWFNVNSLDTSCGPRLISKADGVHVVICKDVPYRVDEFVDNTSEEYEILSDEKIEDFWGLWRTKILPSDAKNLTVLFSS